MENFAELKKIESLARRLACCESILFITGAGISADSGLPTYRGVGGLYDGVLTEEGIPIEMALAGEMLVDRPEVTWKYLAQIEKNCRNAQFNEGHAVIAKMEKVFKRVWVLTQNIDGFHSAAGSKNVIEIHGNMHRLRCDRCGWRRTIQDFSEIKIPPQCPDCHSIARPDVVFFGEMLPAAELEIYSHQLREGFDLYIWVGTTAVFPYIQAPLLDAKAHQQFTVEINPGETEISSQVDLRIAWGAKQALAAVWQAYQKR